MTELCQEVESSSPSSYQIARTFFTATLSLVDVSVFGAVFVPCGAMGFCRLSATRMPAGSNGISNVIFGGSVGQIAPMIVGEVVVEMPDLHAFGTRTDICQSHELMDGFSFATDVDSETTLGSQVRLHDQTTILSIVSAAGNDLAAVFINEVTGIPRNLAHDWSL